MAAEQDTVVVVDASAAVEVLLRSRLGYAASDRMRGHGLHAPAHLDAEVLSALGRLQRTGKIGEPQVAQALDRLAAAPIRRHSIASLVKGAWARRDSQSLLDALYVELAAALGSVPVVTTDARLARSYPGAELVSL